MLSSARIPRLEGADFVDAWFAPDLVLLVDHAVGSRATVGSHSFVKTADEGRVEDQTGEASTAAPRRRRFRRSSTA